MYLSHVWKWMNAMYPSNFMKIHELIPYISIVYTLSVYTYIQKYQTSTSRVPLLIAGLCFEAAQEFLYITWGAVTQKARWNFEKSNGWAEGFAMSPRNSKRLQWITSNYCNHQVLHVVACETQSPPEVPKNSLKFGNKKRDVTVSSTTLLTNSEPHFFSPTKVIRATTKVNDRLGQTVRETVSVKRGVCFPTCDMTPKLDATLVFANTKWAWGGGGC